MRHHNYKPSFAFVSEPVEFDKNTERELLQYCLGATLYMPGTKDITPSILSKKLQDLTSMVMCFEDAIKEVELPTAEDNVLKVLSAISEALSSGQLDGKDIPLIFLRVRNTEQFVRFTERLNEKHRQVLSGFVFPKFNTINGFPYLNHLRFLNESSDSVLYGMPILESSQIAFKESRTYELAGIKSLLKPYRDLILNIRVGATDFSSNFGVRRGINYSIYDILTVKTFCLIFSITLAEKMTIA